LPDVIAKAVYVILSKVLMWQKAGSYDWKCMAGICDRNLDTMYLTDCDFSNFACNSQGLQCL